MIKENRLEKKRDLRNLEDIQLQNCWVVLLFFFQQGLLLPLILIIPMQPLMVGFSALLLGFALFFQRIRFGINTILLFLIPLTLLVLKIPFEPAAEFGEGASVADRLTLGFLTMGLSGILMGSLKISERDFLDVGYKISWANFLFIGAIPFTSLYGVADNALVEYMRFGYAMLPTVLFAFCSMLNKKSLSSAILFSLSLVELVIFGARGAFFSFLFFAALYILFLSKISLRNKFILGGVSVLPIFLFREFLGGLAAILEAIGIRSYAMDKYMALLNGETITETSSGRGDLYSTALDTFYNAPILGSPLNSCKIATGFDYYHNLLLDILVNFGVLVFFLFCVFLGVKSYQTYQTKDRNKQAIFVILLVVSFGRLLLSSSLWLRPEFWLFMSYCVNNISKKDSMVCINRPA